MSRKDHWERIYRDKDETEVSWHQERPLMSLRLIEQSGIAEDKPVIDVGGGASHLADALLDHGFSDITVVDIAGSALAQARARLGERARDVTWIEADATAWAPARSYLLWHDRAVFHFLTEPADRAAYLQVLRTAVPAGGFAAIAAFAPDGPERCSGLPVVRYAPETLQATLGPDFEPMAVQSEEHRTPGGKPQAFIGCLFRRR